MKKPILDIPFKDSFQDFLEKGEKIIWQDSAKKSRYNIKPVEESKKEGSIIGDFFLGSLFEILLNLFANFLIFILYLFVPPSVWISALLIIIIYYYYKYFKKSPLEYGITNQRILFRSIEFRKVKIYEIPFLEINNCIVVENKNNRGSIFLAVKNPETIPFDTFSGEEKSHQPTLENIESPQEVAKLIRQGIRNNL